MARNWQYPRWRRLLMQSAMWAILGGTVGLAALLDRQQHSKSFITLGPPVQCASIRIQLPAHWLPEQSEPGMITASESSTYPPRRALGVTVAPPAENGLIDQLLLRENPTEQHTITFGPKPSPGMLYLWQEKIEDDGLPQRLSRSFSRVIATAILPDGPEVTIRLEHLDRTDQSMDIDDDIDLVRRIAATVHSSAAEIP